MSALTNALEAKTSGSRIGNEAAVLVLREPDAGLDRAGRDGPREDAGHEGVTSSTPGTVIAPPKMERTICTKRSGWIVAKARSCGSRRMVRRVRQVSALASDAT